MISEPTTAAIEEARRLLEAGELIAFATETVYGLGADARNEAAVERIFEAKGRPRSNPLIVHVTGKEEAKRHTQWSEAAEKLADRFWPGPLTLVLPRGPSIPSVVAAGGETLAVRAPKHPVAQALLRAFCGPVAAPSANRSSSISPTRAEDVEEELGPAFLILDGGPCEVGLESTVLDLTNHGPNVLRPGVVGPDAIASVLGIKEVGRGFRKVSPGLLSRHYAPKNTKARLFSLPFVPSDDAVVLSRSTAPVGFKGKWRKLPSSPSEFGQTLYSSLRWADRQGATCIWVEKPPPGDPGWAAIWDRLERATGTKK